MSGFDDRRGGRPPRGPRPSPGRFRRDEERGGDRDRARDDDRGGERDRFADRGFRDARPPRSDRGDRPRFNRDDRPRRTDDRGDRGRGPRPWERSSGGDRPRRFEDRGDRPRFDRSGGDRPRRFEDRGDRPRFNRDDRPRRDDRGERPRFDRGDRPRFDRGGGDRPRRFEDRGDRSGGPRPWDRSGGDRPRRFEDRGDRPRFNRDDRGDRPRRDDRGERPRFDRGGGDRPRFDRGGGDRPRRFEDRGDRPRFNRDDRPRREDRGDRPRFDRGDRPRFDRGGGDRPRRFEDRGDRPRFNRDDRPRREDAGDRPRFNREDGGDRPRFNREDRDDRPRSDREDRPRPERSDRPRGPRPARTSRDRDADVARAHSPRTETGESVDRAVGRPRGAEHEAAVGWSHRALREGEPEGIRLQKVLSQAGIASRRAGEQLIVEGRVTVNGQVADELGVRVDPENDTITVDGQQVEVRPTAIVIALNKPAGVLSTAADDKGRQTVMDLVPETPGLFPIGRLDAETTGLILLTTIGELGHRLMHPKHQVERTYFAEVKGVPTRTTLQKLRHGVELDDGTAKAVRAKVIDEQPGRAHLEIVMTEGRNREVRRMLEAVGHPVRHLGRTAIGPIKLGDLGSGRIRYLSPAEIGSLKALVEL